eukprot:TRINITY_DN1169_c0_g1_i1.p1 TRINITY_DN1169_c0_g1~~TRINITY_DN1169_c0_g1_i1.p1  ORF type:complete len:321 (-),score=106.47 TRINITY_DN1169_c0_g1_i1:62-967(-)
MSKSKQDAKINQIYYGVFQRNFPSESLNETLQACSNVSSLTLLASRAKLMASNAAAVAELNVDQEKEAIRNSDAEIKADVNIVKDEIDHVRSAIRKIEGMASKDTKPKRSAEAARAVVGDKQLAKKEDLHSESTLSVVNKTMKNFMGNTGEEIKSFLKHEKLGRMTIEQRLEIIDTIEKRDFPEYNNIDQKGLQVRVEEIRDLLTEEAAASPSKFAPCFQSFSKFNDTRSMTGEDLKLISLSNQLYNAENCWFNYMISLQQCQSDKKNTGACFAKFKPQEFHCIAQSRDGLTRLKDLVDNA